MTDRNPFVKDKTFALPQALLRRDGFQIFENAALEVVNLVKALRRTWQPWVSCHQLRLPFLKHASFAPTMEVRKRF